MKEYKFDENGLDMIERTLKRLEEIESSSRLNNKENWFKLLSSIHDLTWFLGNEVEEVLNTKPDTNSMEAEE